jgi:hypothetical protein
VLEAFGPEEEKALPPRIEDAARAIATFLESGVQAAMNQWNREADAALKQG